jgi:hypothetical protein
VRHREGVLGIPGLGIRHQLSVAGGEGSILACIIQNPSSGEVGKEKKPFTAAFIST